MIKSLEERKTRLLLEIEELKREIKLLYWLENQELATIRRIGYTDFLYLYSLEEESMN